METLHVTIIYESEEGVIKPTTYQLMKTFQFNKLPCCSNSRIILYDDAIKEIIFNNVSYDPKEDIHYVTNYTSEDVHRYYHGDAKTIMSKVIERYKSFGWSAEEIKK